MRKRCRRRVWSTEINPIAHAIAGACITDSGSLNELRVGEVRSLELMKTGEAGVQEWQILVDMMNIAETMGRNGIGPEVLEHCEIANEALHRAAKRYQATKRMGLSGEGLKALADIMEYHDLQRTSVSRAKYQQMIDKTRNYLKSHGKYVTHIEQTMTQDEIYELARQAYENCDHIPDLKIPKEFVERFAKLVAAKERDALVLLLRNLADDHTPSECADMICALQSLGVIRARGEA